MKKNIIRSLVIVCVVIMTTAGGSFSEIMETSDYKIPTSILDGHSTIEVSTDYLLYGAGGQATSIGTSETADYFLRLGYIYTLSTEGNQPNLTSIYRIWINNTAFTSGDVLPPNRTNTVSIEVTDVQSVETVVMLLDGIDVPLLEQAPPSPPPLNSSTRYYWQGSFNTPSSPPTSHYLTFYTSDEVVNEGIATLEAKVITGAVQVVGQPLNYPNPFSPLSGGPSAVTKIQYMLSDDASITIIIYDITGQEVRRGTYSTGSQGGRAGVNTIEWNGKSMFNKVVGNGMYIYKIISNGRTISTGKIVIVD
ncbi:T9SS type A sorting domain-containing protein [Candidatus Margulisiibacteriota bacterium]